MMESKRDETAEELEERLNEGLEETFPASDPVAVHHEDKGDDSYDEPDEPRK
jgi:hypothetical protein